MVFFVHKGHIEKGEREGGRGGHLRERKLPVKEKECE
jgi:hypothetical protein